MLDSFGGGRGGSACRSLGQGLYLEPLVPSQHHRIEAGLRRLLIDAHYVERLSDKTDVTIFSLVHMEIGGVCMYIYI